MPARLLSLLKHLQRTSGVAPTLGEFEESYRKARDAGSGGTRSHSKKLSDLYYDLVTDFYEFGWGRSFHFAPRVPGESLDASLARHEHYIAHVLGLRPGMVVADIGCGIGGPLLEIARFSGAKIVGINSNAYQIERARKLTEEAGLTHLAEYMECDFLSVDTPDDSFDATFSIEATCHVPDKTRIYGEIFRILKPGAGFAAYEYCLTDRFDANDPHHIEVKSGVERSTGLTDIVYSQVVNNALLSVGFELLEARDLAEQPGPSVPWYQPLVGSGLSLASFRSSSIGRFVNQTSLRALETLRIVPTGTVSVAKTLNISADSLAEAGRLGIVTPMYFFHARKPV